jgi:phage terminase small subunit
MATAQKAETYDGSTPLKNARHETFAHEYISTENNGAQAALNAGYAANGARQRAYHLLTNDYIWTRIKYLRDKRLEKSRRSAAEIIKELENIAFSNIADSVRWDPDTGMTYVKGSDELPREVSAAIESIQVTERASGGKSDESMVLSTKVKLHPKLPALIKLGMEHGLFKEKVEHSGSVAHTIEVVDYGSKGTDK